MLIPVQGSAQIAPPGGYTSECRAAPPALGEETTKQLEAAGSQGVEIQCLTDNIVVIRFGEEEISSLFGWSAVDAFAKSNYTVDDVVSSGMGSQGNPTRFFVIMSKD